MPSRPMKCLPLASLLWPHLNFAMACLACSFYLLQNIKGLSCCFYTLFFFSPYLIQEDPICTSTNSPKYLQQLVKKLSISNANSPLRSLISNYTFPCSNLNDLPPSWNTFPLAFIMPYPSEFLSNSLTSPAWYSLLVSLLLDFKMSSKRGRKEAKEENPQDSLRPSLSSAKKIYPVYYQYYRLQILYLQL